MGQPRHAQLFRPPLHEPVAHRLGGDSVGRGHAEWRPGQGAVLAGQRPSSRDDPAHRRQVYTILRYMLACIEFLSIEKGRLE